MSLWMRGGVDVVGVGDDSAKQVTHGNDKNDKYVRDTIFSPKIFMKNSTKYFRILGPNFVE